MRQRYTLDDIRAFVEAARLGTLSSAGAELSVPASTIGRAITRLEQYTGLLLMRRSPGGLTLTDAGREYLTSCDRALGALRDGDNALDHHRSKPTGNLRVLCPYILAQDILAPLLPMFTEMHPGLVLDVALYASRWDQEPKVDTDIVFKVINPRDSARRVHRFPGARTGLFASRAYLDQHGTPVLPEDLLSHRCMSAAPIPDTKWVLTRGTTILHQPVECFVRSVEPELRLSLTLASQGIAPLPMWLALRPDYSKVLVQVLPKWQTEVTVLSALYYGVSKQTPKVKLFLEFLTTYIGTRLDPRLKGAPFAKCFAGSDGRHTERVGHK